MLYYYWNNVFFLVRYLYLFGKVRFSAFLQIFKISRYCVLSGGNQSRAIYQREREKIIFQSFEISSLEKELSFYNPRRLLFLRTFYLHLLQGKTWAMPITSNYRLVHHFKYSLYTDRPYKENNDIFKYKREYHYLQIPSVSKYFLYIKI